MTASVSGSAKRPRLDLRHHPARRRAMPRRDHDPRGEARGRRAARRHGRRHHRGRASRSPRTAISRPSPRSPSSVKNATVAGLARAISADIARAGEAVRHAARPRIHTFVSTSPIHLAHQMRKTEDEVLEIITATVTQARNLVEDVEWSAMDATRTSDRLSLPLRRSGDQGRRHHHQPARHGRLRDAGRVPRACSAPCASACRMPTRRSSRPIATTISASPSRTRWPALEGGARQIECTINGIGERAGNAALEEIVMAITHPRRRAALRDRHRRRRC